MTLRARLVWAFSTMLLVPLLLMGLLGGVVQGFWMPEDDMAAVGALNAVLLDNPESLLTSEGFDAVAHLLPSFVIAGLESGGTWRQTSKGFITTGSRVHQRTLFEWRFRLSDGTIARLETRFYPHQLLTEGGWHYLVLPLVAMLILILTNGTLTWLVSRSILSPLRQLEVAARRLGQGDLAPSDLPTAPPEFRRVGAAFEEMRQRLKASLAEREQNEEERRVWVASVSHDLRTPLAVVRGYAEGLRDGMASTPEKHERYVGVLLDRARQMERLVDDLFQWARWDWSQPELQRQSLSLSAEVSRAVTDWAVDWPTLTVHWDPPVPSGNGVSADTLSTDSTALRRILDNLARNAVQHSGDAPHLWVTQTGSSSGWTLTFRDQGAGISADILPRVFERFFRGDPARDPSWGGGGLGLTIARALAEALGGTLTAGNAPEGGAQFTLTLSC